MTPELLNNEKPTDVSLPFSTTPATTLVRETGIPRELPQEKAGLNEGIPSSTIHRVSPCHLQQKACGYAAAEKHHHQENTIGAQELTKQE
ncbi:hypothetical protein E6O75_ATG02658 [Venturia nashicola]|uniref:Uncharacterized protein n=1 Tax=Venturia nashicola TaxID=86259 RepID=A0A4Z1P5Q2_9PEZI|nr:hypothetical protein E6O75_ATG02658 [Venturia nashicola]